ncbi:hypothetical protein CR513_26318, partial [Mucuna pruriens]
MRMAEQREEELRQQIAALKAADRRESAAREEGIPFCKEIDEILIPPNFREVVVEPFDGTQDPHAHLQAFQAQMHFKRSDYALDGDPSSQFAANKVKKLEVADLFDIKQSRGESLKSYLARFNNVTVRVDDPDQKNFGLRAGSFSDTLALRRLSSMEEIRTRAEKHVEARGHDVTQHFTPPDGENDTDIERDLPHKAPGIPSRG